MGTRQSRPSNSSTIDTQSVNDTGPKFQEQGRGLLFHKVCGKHIKISEDKKTATRSKRYDFGITFSSNPFCFNELVSFEITEITDCNNNTSWIGDMRLGVTTIDPLNPPDPGFPPYAASYLKKEDGYWTTALPESYASTGIKISFYIDQDGTLKLRKSEEEFQNLIEKLPLNNQFWIMIDVYGNTKSILLHDIRPKLEEPQVAVSSHISVQPGGSNQVDDSSSDSGDNETVSQSRLAFRQVPSPPTRRRQPFNYKEPEVEDVWESRASEDETSGFTSFTSFSSDGLPGAGPRLKCKEDHFDDDEPRDVAIQKDQERLLKVDQTGEMTAQDPNVDVYEELKSIYDKDLQLLDRDCSFLSTSGPGVEFVKQEKNRIRTKYVKNASCLAFSETPLEDGTWFYFKVFKTSTTKKTLKFGVTSSDPSQLDADELPSDPEQLKEREDEYWVVETIDSELQDGDLVSINIGYDGYLNIDVNHLKSERLCHCGAFLQTLWLFIDLSGNVEDLLMIAVENPP